MKYTNCCPKCQHSEIAIIEGGTFKGNTYNSITMTLKVIYLTRYVCTKCGYCENYVEDQDDLESIKKKFTRSDFPDDYV